MRELRGHLPGRRGDAADPLTISPAGPDEQPTTGRIGPRRRHLIRETMQDLEKGLDPAHFLRIHRSAIVAVDRVDTLLRGAGGDYEVKLKSGARLGVARSRRAELERRMGMRGRGRP